jgi:hypothetical protein
MERPVAFVADLFIDHLEKQEQKASYANNYTQRADNKKKHETIGRVINFLLAANINTDCPEPAIVKYYKKACGNKNYETLKEHIYLKAVKDGRINSSKHFQQSFTEDNFSVENFLSIVNNQKAIYFIPCDTNKSKEIEKLFGLVAIGTDFNFDGFYEDRKIASKRISKKMDELELCKHPCNSMIIVDPYFFSSRNREVDKAPGIIKTIKTFMSETLSIKFHLLILTKNKEGFDYQPKVNLLADKCGGPDKIFIEVYTPENIFSDDRIILTNYANINIGHPYDRDSYLNCNIFFSDINEETIKRNYEELLELCNLVRKQVETTPKTHGLIKTIIKTNDCEKSRLL